MFTRAEHQQKATGSSYVFSQYER